MADRFPNSNLISLRRRFRQISQWQGKRSKAVYGRQAEGQGRRHEGYQDGADFEEGPGSEGEAVDIHFKLVQYNSNTQTRLANVLVLVLFPR